MASTDTASRTEGTLLRTAPAPVIPQKDDIGFKTIRYIDGDADLTFPLRGHGYNPLIDGALPLFGLVIRLRNLETYAAVSELYETVRDQIAALDEEMHRHDYDSATLLAYRYALCTFIDEAVMRTPWGSQSVWAERSLLSTHHNETWGGEKFFTVLSRMLMAPEKYRDMLEFKYLCLCLGFKGKYGERHDQAEMLQALIARLHRVLRGLRGDAPESLTDARRNVASRRYRIGQQWPWWTPWVCALVVLVIAYTLYAVNLGNTTDEVLRALNATLAH